MDAPSTSPHWDLASMSVEEKVGQLIMVRYPDVALLEEALAAGHAGAFYFGMKGKSAEEVAQRLNRLQTIAKHPAFVAFGASITDCGTGLLLGLNMRIGATRSPELAYRVGKLTTVEERAYGCHIVGAPVIDVNTNPANPIINTRAFSDNAELVTELGLEMLRGITEANGVTCGMHFPGHGFTSHDSHIRVPVDDRSLDEIRAVDLAPYRAAIAAGVLNGVCTNHVHYPALTPGAPAPSTVSRRVITGLLREELGYTGLIMSDSLTMRPMKDGYGIEEAAVLTVLAGHDIILQDYQSEPRITHRALVEAVESGRIPLAQVDASVTRIMEMKERLGLFRNPLVNFDEIPGRVATDEHKALAVRVAREAVTVLENDALPLRASGPSKLLVVANGSEAAWNADMDVTYLPTFEKLHRSIRRRVPEVETYTLGEQMTGEEIGRALELAREATTVVFGLFTRVLCYHEDSIGVAPPYVDLIRQAVGMGKTVVLLNFGNPYVMKDLPRAAASLCTYDSDCGESIEAAVEALFGEIPTTGKLPVSVSADYPFGLGL